MATNLALDDKLVAAAKRLGRHRTKRDAVNEALREVSRRGPPIARSRPPPSYTGARF